MSAYGNILVWAGGGPEQDRPVDWALDLSRRFAARLTGVAACRPTPVVLDPLGAGPDFEALRNHYREAAERTLSKRRDRFEGRAEAVAVQVAWREAVDDPSDLIVRTSLGADLIVLPMEKGNGRPDGASVTLRAGRPVLLVPTYASNLRLDRVVIAWRDGREARLAVSSALPLLQAAKGVTLLSVRGDAVDHELDQQLGDVRSWLLGHGVEPWVETTRAEDRPLGRLILDDAERFGADLIVAGAYGHSRLAEWALGGVTRTLMSESSIPLLLAH